MWGSREVAMSLSTPKSWWVDILKTEESVSVHRSGGQPGLRVQLRKPIEQR